MVMMTAEDVAEHKARIDRDRITLRPWAGVDGMADGQHLLMFRLLVAVYYHGAESAVVRRAVSQ